MSERRQCHSNLRVQTGTKGWIFIVDTPKDFAILQSEPKIQQVFGKKVNVSLPKPYQSANATKEEVWSLRKYLITLSYAEAERMKSRRSSRYLSFIKSKCDDTKQAEALISRGLVCQKTGIIFKVKEFRTTPSIQQCYKYQGLG